MLKTTEEVACIGRETELDSLAGFLDKAVGGQGRIVFVTGEPGAGKSTLLQEFVRRSEQRLPELVLALVTATRRPAPSIPTCLFGKFCRG